MKDRKRDRSRKRLPKRVALFVVAVLLGGLLAVPAAVTAMAGTPEACSAADADIYRPPDRATATPGAVVACRRVDALPMVGNGTPFDAWKVQYGSTDGRSRPVSVVGTVVVPKEPWKGAGERPLVGFVPGTLGIGPQCAFSKQLAGQYQDAYEGPNISALLKAGYAVAATDGAGYMDGQVHPYVNGVEAGHAALDMARAALRMPGSGVAAGAPVGFWGYSEGGSGSLWAAQVARSYAPELHVVGVASGGIPADLKEVSHGLDGGFFAGFLIDAVIGLSVTHPDMPFQDLLDDGGHKAVKDAESLCAIGTVTRFAGARIEQYTKDHLTLDQMYALHGPDGTTWSDVAAGNKLGVGLGTPGSGARYEVGFPVLQYRGVLDEVIPAKTADGVRQAYCAAGITTQWKPYVGDHLTGDFQAVGDTVAWLGDRFEGKETKGNC
ncbi:lipase family protein [Streptomyces sp. NPDC046805]|uniref:lipase family protein n=1 Tax=Streptomyces sp. NPDC046805 TaxID=3155134 RepID=UPI0033ECE430